MVKEIAIDMGTTTTRVYAKDKGLVVVESTAVAVDTRKDEVIAVGKDAKEMIGREPENVKALTPMEEGVISDFDAACHLLRQLIKQTIGQTYFGRPVVKLSFPLGITEVEEMALREVAGAAGGKKIEIIPAISAAAVGAALPFTGTTGCMIVDIGGGHTEAAVLAMKSIITNKMERVGGNTVTAAIIPYIKREYGMLIGENTAEMIKINIGSAIPKVQEEFLDISGRDLHTGLPKTVTVSSTEITEAISDAVSQIIDVIKETLDATKPALISDIAAEGITLVGAGALLDGLDKKIALDTGISVTIADSPVECVIAGLGRCLANEATRKMPAMYKPRRIQGDWN